MTLSPSASGAGVVGADVAGALFRREELGCEGRGAEPGCGRAAGHRAQKRFARNRDEDRQLERLLLGRSSPASTLRDASGLLLRKKPMPGSRISRSAGDPGAFEPARRSAKKVWIRRHTSSADSASRCALLVALHGMHDDEAAARGGQRGIDALGSGKPWMSFR